MDSVKSLFKALNDCGLMDGETIRNFWTTRTSGAKPRNEDELAEELIRLKRLTPYQYMRIKMGEAKSLKLDQYTIVDQIGKGGMGQVLKARHERMQRYVAVKMISDKYLVSSEAVERFKQEARAAAQLSHQNIVAAYDAGERNGTHYLVMEYVDGQDLASILSAKGELRVALALDYVLQAAEGLQYSHRKGVVHRDIKPANLLVDSSGVVKILDMGLAFFAQDGSTFEDTADMRLTQKGEVMGTCSYMAPEQAIDFRKADARSDIYSLGCTLFELLVGHPPYRGHTHMAVIVAHREEPIPSLCVYRSEVPPALDKVFQKMVAKKPKDRYTTMNEVIVALRACMFENPSAPSVAETPVPAPRKPIPIARPVVASPPTPVSGPQAPYVVGEVAVCEEVSTPAFGETFKVIEAKKDTITSRRSLQRKPSLMKKLSQPATLATVLLGGLAMGAVCLGVMLSIRTPQGTLQITSDDPNVKVSVKQGGKIVEIIDAEDNWQIRLNEGKYELEVSGGKDQIQLDQNHVVVSRGKVERLRATLKPVANVAKVEEASPATAIPLIAAKPSVSDPPTTPAEAPMPSAKPETEPATKPEPTAVANSPTIPMPNEPMPVVPVPAEPMPKVPAPNAVAVAQPEKRLPANGVAAGPVVEASAKLKELNTVLAHARKITGVAFSPDGKIVATCGDDGRLVVWGGIAGERKQEVLVLDEPILQLAFTPDGKTLAFVTATNGIGMVDVKSGKVSKFGGKPVRAAAEIKPNRPFTGLLGFGSKAKTLLTGNNTNELQIWNAKGEEIANLAEHLDIIWEAEYSPDQTKFATASGDGSARIWDAETNKTLHIIKDGSSVIYSVAFSRDGSTLFTAGNATNVVGWNVETGEQKMVLAGHGGPIQNIAVSADGKMLASVSYTDNSVRFWDLETGAIRSVIRNSPQLPEKLFFSPVDPKFFVTVAQSNMLRFWRYDGEDVAVAGNIRTAPDGTIVVHQEVGDDHLIMPPWQTFTAPIDGTITLVELQPNAYGGAMGDFSIYEGEGIQGTKQLYTDKYVLGSRAQGIMWTPFLLKKPLAVEAGKVYTWELTGAKGMKHAISDRYAEGHSSTGTQDLCFRVYIKPTKKVEPAKKAP